MNTSKPGPDIARSALIVVDMQNDFLHPDGGFGKLAQDHPERSIDTAFLASTIPVVCKLVAAFRASGLPVVWVAHVLKEDYSDAAFPYWRGTMLKKTPFLVEGSWGAQIVDELAPRKQEHRVIKKGFGGFSNTPLDTILRNHGVSTCVVCGVTTCVCVSTTVRGGVEHNYRMIVVRDAVAEVNREQHESELKTLARVFGDVKAADEVVAMLAHIAPGIERSTLQGSVLG